MLGSLEFGWIDWAVAERSYRLQKLRKTFDNLEIIYLKVDTHTYKKVHVLGIENGVYKLRTAGGERIWDYKPQYTLIHPNTFNIAVNETLKRLTLQYPDNLIYVYLLKHVNRVNTVNMSEGKLKIIHTLSEAEISQINQSYKQEMPK